MLKMRWNRRVQLSYQKKFGPCLLIAFLLFAAYEGRAKERLNRMLDRNSGLPIESLSGYAQDTHGFFWISTAAGLFRYNRG
jgi:ligand-binding sensor domain-containing protein